MEFSDEQRLIRDSVREYVQRRIVPFAADWDRDNRFPAEQLREMAELGLFGMFIPQQWGGSGADYLSFALAIEEVAAGDGSCSTILSVNNSVVCGLLLASGSEFLKQTYLKPLASGDMLGCFCLTEPHAGSDASALKTRAQRCDDGYLLNGSKAFITSGSNADVAIVFAVTDPGAGKKGISAFVVPTDNPGYQVGGVEHKMGQHASDTASIFLKDCLVPADHLIGGEGDGYRIALMNLEGGRIGIGAQCVGMARAACECALAYARERISFGKKLIEHQAVAFRLADMATQLEASRLMVHNAARLRDAGEPCLKQASMAKLFASEAAERICSDAIQVLGGYGYLRDFPVERIARDVRVAQIYEGTSDIQRIVIARELAAG
ncbi:MAG: acyl-CoA dehydrogenase family protein [Gammaproteobacteria bacterium]|nr:acyl-CoA dehydrogenase family protein [Gammaproteobacteria bacterium]MDH3448839.1 acyl-CoA dehydrogenase family protein [Gammaproteobacteria bacterium]